MSDSPRKTLGLPAKPGSETSQDAARKPVRGGAPKIRTIKKAAVEATASPKPAPARTSGNASTSKHAGGYAFQAKSTESAEGGKPRVRIVAQEKPRGTPSRAPVVPKSAGAVQRQPKLADADKAPQSGVRISKLMAERGLCSRREADSFIERGWVFVDGERVTELGTRADPSARIRLDKGAQAAQRQQVPPAAHLFFNLRARSSMSISVESIPSTTVTILPVEVWRTLVRPTMPSTTRSVPLTLKLPMVPRVQALAAPRRRWRASRSRNTARWK